MFAESSIKIYPPCETLRRARISKGLTQTALSALLIRNGHNIRSNYISEFESGSRQIWPSARQAIAQVLGMSESELFPEI